MRKLVVAGMLGLAVFGGWQATAFAQPLFKFGSQKEQPVIMAQMGDSAGRIQQLEEEIRSLNGRIEEMSFQLLQMQEQMRKTQEDNEYRFQELEKSGTDNRGALDAPSAPVAGTAPAAGPAAGDDVARIIETPQEGGAAPGAPETTLGSIRLDSNGMPVGGTLNEPGANASSLPGVETAAPSQTAALGSDEDLYKAAYGHVLSGDYALAEQEFVGYLHQYPEGTKAADASFWLGEAQYSQGKFNDAARTFLNAHQTYGQSPRAPEMLLKLGISLAALDNPEVACKTLREVATRYPGAPKAVLGKADSEQKRLSC